jgi:sulfoxide reductase heme-binding subunit YedZ
VGFNSGTALWYASRATGVVALLLLTIVAVLGIMVTRRRRLPGLPRFATTSLHRSTSLLAVSFTIVHVVTAIADPYVTIGVAAAVIPLASAYKPLWLGLGAVSLDIMIALIVTSLARARLGRRRWRAVHWLAYASWPAAVLHGIGSGDDLHSGWLLALTVLCVAAVAAAACVRVGAGAPRSAVRRLGHHEAAGGRGDAIAMTIPGSGLPSQCRDPHADHDIVRPASCSESARQRPAEPASVTTP